MCYTGHCQWENYMGDCTKYNQFDSLPCPTEFEILNCPDGKVEVIEFDIVGGPYEPIQFDNEYKAKDYIKSREFAYEFLIKIIKER